jgi:nucleoside-diphosphate-sugar epimerase
MAARPPSLYLPYRTVDLLAGAMEMIYRTLGIQKRPLLTRQSVSLLASRAYIDSSKARKVLGWSPAVGQEDAIQRTMDWLVSLDVSQWKVK